jgi:hypothetical protein
MQIAGDTGGAKTDLPIYSIAAELHFHSAFRSYGKDGQTTANLLAGGNALAPARQARTSAYAGVLFYVSRPQVFSTLRTPLA